MLYFNMPNIYLKSFNFIFILVFLYCEKYTQLNAIVKVQKDLVNYDIIRKKVSAIIANYMNT